MAKFFALYLAPITEIDKWMKNVNPEEMKKGMDEWNKWMKDHKNVFDDMGSPLGKTKRLTKDGLSDTRNEITGYSIVEADSHEAAAKLFGGHPHLQIPGASIDILKVTEMPK